MQTQTQTQTEQAEKQTKLPSVCKNCKHIVSRAPVWLQVLEAMSPGTGNRGISYTRSALAKNAGITRQHLESALNEAIEEKLVELSPDVAGTKAYRKTKYGCMVLSTWKAAGWKKLQRKSA